jgi:winged helix domain-containing protein
MTARIRVEAVAYLTEGKQRFIVRGQTAKTLIALVNGRDRGVTALEAASRAYRFAACCFELRTRYGLTLRTEREEHPGGWHGRHFLETPVRIVFVADPEQEADAA